MCKSVNIYTFNLSNVCSHLWRPIWSDYIWVHYKGWFINVHKYHYVYYYPFHWYQITKCDCQLNWECVTENNIPPQARHIVLLRILVCFLKVSSAGKLVGEISIKLRTRTQLSQGCCGDVCYMGSISVLGNKIKHNYHSL